MSKQSSFSDAMIGWYDQYRRDLPWRYAPGVAADPYRVWLSEIMLQQTTVATVKEYFERFTARFPTVFDLAATDEEEIMAMWSGLGYYSRARNLYRCAKEVVSRFDGQFPSDEKKLKSLPGIGEYTAAAIRAIAFDKPAVVVDGNIERIIARVGRVATPLPKGKKEIDEKAALYAPQKRPGDYVQGMMDLGATVCLPRNPLCGKCPVQSFCQAYHNKTQEKYPVKAPKKKVPVRKAAAFVLLNDIEASSRARRRPAHSRGGSDLKNQNQDKKQYEVLLKKRPDTGMLAGMMEVPSSPWSAAHDTPEKEWLAHAPITMDWDVLPTTVRHVFSHVKLELTVYVGVLAGQGYNLKEDERWVAPQDMDTIGLPTVFRKVLESAGKL